MINEQNKLESVLIEDSNKFKTLDEFWFQYKSKYPNIFNCFLHLSNFPASSAYRERFFSICGVISDKRSGNISKD